MQQLRAFVGINIPRHLKKAIYQQISPLFGLLKSCNWVEKQNLHLNIKFIPDLASEKISLVENTVQHLADKFQPFRLQVNGIQFFPHINNPHVMSLKVIPHKKLQQLHYDLDQRLATQQITPTDKRKYNPHITLCRIKSKVDPHITIQLMKQLDMQFEFEVHALHLFESTLTADGPIYDIVFTKKLSA